MWCGNAGIFVPREKGLIWKSVLNKLMTDDNFYQECSRNALARAKELSVLAEQQLAEFEKIIDEAEL